MGWWSNTVNAVTKPVKQLVSKSVDIGKKVLPAMATVGSMFSGGSGFGLDTLGKIVGIGSNIFGMMGGSDPGYDSALAWENFGLQKDLAYNGLQARVADAKKAGIHPLAALGMQPMGGSPVPVGGNNYDKTANLENIARLLQSFKTPEEREKEQIELEMMRNEKRLSDMQLTVYARDNLNHVGSRPPIVTSPIIQGQGDHETLQVQPAQPTAQRASGISEGSFPMWETYEDNGWIKLRPSQQYSQSVEGIEPFGAFDTLINLGGKTYNIKAAISNLEGGFMNKTAGIMPGRGPNRSKIQHLKAREELFRWRDWMTSKFDLQPGYEWRMDHKGSFKAVKKGGNNGESFFFIDGWGGYDNNLKRR